MISIAAGLAVSNNLDSIYLGVHTGDHAVYPDCRRIFIETMKHAVKFGTNQDIIIYAPYVNLSKIDIVKHIYKYNIDFSKTYSCYKGGEIHCGVCSTCRERKTALVGVDNTKYKV